MNVLVSDIQERVRVLCDLPAYTSDTPITTAAILDLVKVATELLAALVGSAASSEMYFATKGQLTTTPNVATVALPSATFTGLMRLSWQRTATEDVPLDVASVDELDAWPLAWTTMLPFAGRVKYRLLSESIQFFPTPDAAYTLNITYTTGLSPTSAADTLVLRAGWDLWIALQTAMLVRMRQQKDPSDIAQMLAKVEGDIRSQLKRDHWGVRQIRDVRSMPSRSNRFRWW